MSEFGILYLVLACSFWGSF